MTNEQVTMTGSDGRKRIFDIAYRRGPLAVSEIGEGTGVWTIFCIPAQCTIPAGFPSSLAAAVAIDEMIDTGLLTRIKDGQEQDIQDSKKIEAMIEDFNNVIEGNGGVYIFGVDNFVEALFAAIMHFCNECRKEGLI